MQQRPLLEILFNGGAFVTGPDGTAIADVPLSAGRTGTNYIDREVIAKPLKENITLIGQPTMGKKLGAPVFSIATPIQDAQGKVIGALVGVVNLGLPSFLDKITWDTISLTGTDETTCGFQAGEYVIFRIDVTSQSNANVYVENLEFRYTNT